MKYTPGLWKHKTRKTTFSLCVDNFGVKYFSKADSVHLVNSMKSHYKCTVDWEGALYYVLDLKWNYEKGYVDVSMNGYIHCSLNKFNHVPPSRPQHSLHIRNKPVYGRKTSQQPTNSSTAAHLDKYCTICIQYISGKFLYYSKIYPCIKPALNEISSEKSAPIEYTNNKASMIMYYLHAHPNVTLRYHASNMIIIFESDSTYLVLPKSCSRASAWYIISNNPAKHRKTMNNSPVHIMCNIIKNVMSSAAEAKTGGIFVATQCACPIRIT